jgi:uncharacterized protein
MAWFSIGETTKVFVKVMPNAKHDVIEGLVTMEDQERLVIRVQAPPDKAKANKAVCALLAKSLGIPKSVLTISTGEKSRLKTVAIDRLLNVDVLMALPRS